jgi:hypothetical protein
MKRRNQTSSAGDSVEQVIAGQYSAAAADHCAKQQEFAARQWYLPPISSQKRSADVIKRQLCKAGERGTCLGVIVLPRTQWVRWAHLLALLPRCFRDDPIIVYVGVTRLTSSIYLDRADFSPWTF